MTCSVRISGPSIAAVRLGRRSEVDCSDWAAKVDTVGRQRTTTTAAATATAGCSVDLMDSAKRLPTTTAVATATADCSAHSAEIAERLRSATAADSTSDDD